MLRTGGLLALLLCLGTASAYYLPGTYPQEFLVGDVIQGEGTAPEQPWSTGDRGTGLYAD